MDKVVHGRMVGGNIDLDGLCIAESWWLSWTESLHPQIPCTRDASAGTWCSGSRVPHA